MLLPTLWSRSVSRLCAYFIGSTPIGLVVGKMKGIDIREHGSGNIGATNVLRTLGKPVGITVLVFDILKGMIPVFIAMALTDNSVIHVATAIATIHEAVKLGANEVVIWGSGKPMREFLHVDDMAAASVYVMELDLDSYLAHTEPTLSHINVGTGIDCTIRELAETIARVAKFSGDLVFDSTKPDGTKRKLMDVSRLSALGWNHQINLQAGLEDTYDWYVKNILSARK